MQLDAQEYLDVVEKGGELVMYDCESSNLQADYGKLVVGSIKPFGKKAELYSIGDNFSDKGLAKAIKERLEAADAWVTFYGKGFDLPFINTRLIRWGYFPVEKRPHIDMYYILKHNTLAGRRSQAHMLEFLEDTMEIIGIKKQAKMTVSPNVWADLFANFHKNINILRDRCESDTEGLEALYRVARHLIRDIKR